jgi:prepilin-type N-terminal cleavage/methylation domain-containing protein
VRRSGGYTVVEVVVAMAIFSIFLLVLAGLQSEFVRFDREIRVQMFSHPAPLSVLARLQRDILDSTSYPVEFREWTQSPLTLLLAVPGDDGSGVVVWDFTEAGMARRSEFAKGGEPIEWTARAVPQYEIGSYEMPDGRVAVRVRSVDEKGRLSVDRVILPRAD